MADTVKVCAPDGAAREVQVGGRRYKSRDGVYSMAPSDAKLLRNAGGFASTLTGSAPNGTGFTCVDCGFGSWFTICSRCGGTCAK